MTSPSIDRRHVRELMSEVADTSGIGRGRRGAEGRAEMPTGGPPAPDGPAQCTAEASQEHKPQAFEKACVPGWPLNPCRREARVHPWHASAVSSAPRRSPRWAFLRASDFFLTPASVRGTRDRTYRHREPRRTVMPSTCDRVSRRGRPGRARLLCEPITVRSVARAGRCTVHRLVSRAASCRRSSRPERDLGGIRDRELESGDHEDSPGRTPN